MGAEGVDELAGDIERREVAREAVAVVDAREGLVRDASGRLVVSGLDTAQANVRRAAGGGRFDAGGD
jgi:hypothetical protein